MANPFYIPLAQPNFNIQTPQNPLNDLASAFSSGLEQATKLRQVEEQIKTSQQQRELAAAQETRITAEFDAAQAERGRKELLRQGLTGLKNEKLSPYQTMSRGVDIAFETGNPGAALRFMGEKQKVMNSLLDRARSGNVLDLSQETGIDPQTLTMAYVKPTPLGDGRFAYVSDAGTFIHQFPLSEQQQLQQQLNVTRLTQQNELEKHGYTTRMKMLGLDKLVQEIKTSKTREMAAIIRAKASATSAAASLANARNAAKRLNLALASKEEAKKQQIGARASTDISRSARILPKIGEKIREAKKKIALLKTEENDAQALKKIMGGADSEDVVNIQGIVKNAGKNTAQARTVLMQYYQSQQDALEAMEDNRISDIEHYLQFVTEDQGSYVLTPDLKAALLSAKARRRSRQKRLKEQANPPEPAPTPPIPGPTSPQPGSAPVPPQNPTPAKPVSPYQGALNANRLTAGAGNAYAQATRAFLP